MRGHQRCSPEHPSHGRLVLILRRIRYFIDSLDNSLARASLASHPLSIPPSKQVAMRSVVLATSVRPLESLMGVMWGSTAGLQPSSRFLWKHRDSHSSSLAAMTPPRGPSFLQPSSLSRRHSKRYFGSDTAAMDACVGRRALKTASIQRRNEVRHGKSEAQHPAFSHSAWQ